MYKKMKFIILELNINILIITYIIIINIKFMLPSINTYQSNFNSNTVFSPKNKPNSNSTSPTNKTSTSSILLNNISEKNLTPYPPQISNSNLNCRYQPILVQPTVHQNNFDLVESNISEDILNLALYVVDMSYTQFNSIDIDTLELFTKTVPTCWAINILIYYKKLGNPSKSIEKKYIK
jgi:hypothetical protein